MRSLQFRHIVLRFLLGLVFLFLTVLSGHAQKQADVSGRYACAEAKVRGRAMPCSSAPLILKSSGRFELQGREGDYFTKGSWLILSGQERRTRAKIAPGHSIIFRYRCGKGTCEVRYERRVAELGNVGLG